MNYKLINGKHVISKEDVYLELTLTEVLEMWQILGNILSDDDKSLEE